MDINHISVSRKKCSKCRKELPHSDFHKDKTRKTGLACWCKICIRNNRNQKPKQLLPCAIHNKSIANMSYLAGLIDGEGHIGLAKKKGRKSSFSARMCITLTNRILYEIKDSVGDIGKIKKVKSKKKNHKDRYDWYMYNSGCRALLPLVLPYLRVKNQQAELMLEYLSICRNRNRKRIEQIYDELKKLNKRGTERSSK